MSNGTERSFAESVTSLEDAGRLRAVVRVELVERWGTDLETVERVVLVLSELVTNAFEHARADIVWVDVAHAGGVVSLVVTYDDAAAVPASGPMPPPAQLDGRGLAIASALSSSMTSSWTGGRSTVTCTFGGDV